MIVGYDFCTDGFKKFREKDFLNFFEWMKITKRQIGYLLILIQLLIWVLIIIGFAESDEKSDGYWSAALSALWLCLPFILVINFNWYYLAPQYLKGREYRRYFLYLFGCILFCALVLLFNPYIDSRGDMWLIISSSEDRILIPKLLTLIYGLSMIYLLSMPFYLSVGWFDQRQQIERLETEQLRTELGSLKMQINPHFFFNTLNNLHALTLINSEKASEAVLKLSEMMRYVIYDASKPEVTIQEELDYLQGYFDLQKMRFGTQVEINFSHSLDDPGTKVAPLLFINILENAFKHGADSMIENASVQCQLKLEKRKLSFFVKNSFEQRPDEHVGVGLQNLRRRLSILYPSNHRLDVQEHKGFFEVRLTIDKTDDLHNS